MNTVVETIRCPKCEKVMELDKIPDDRMVTCSAPLCHTTFRVERPTTKPEPQLVVPDSVEVEDQEREQHNSDAKPENVVARFETPTYRRHPIHFSAYLLICLFGVVGLIMAAFSLSITGVIASGIVLIAGATLLIRWYLDARQKSVIITEESVIFRNGIVSEQSQEIHHATITDVHIYQPMLCRMLDTGALELEWGNTPNDRLYLHAVSKPREIVKLIRERTSDR